MTDAHVKLAGIIVSGPTPDENGDVVFKVRVGDQIVTGVANLCGHGWGPDAATVDLANAAMEAVQRFTREHGGHHGRQMLALYREAAGLRRAAGKPAFAGNTRRGKVHLIGSPTLEKDCARFATRAGAHQISIMIFHQGGFIDHCDNWDAVSNEDLDEAFTVCLDYVLTHPHHAAALGLDVGLLEELWR